VPPSKAAFAGWRRTPLPCQVPVGRCRVERNQEERQLGRPDEVRALLHAGRELGPGMDETLIASYLGRQPALPVRSQFGPTQALELASRALLRPRFVPALVLGANIGLGAVSGQVVVHGSYPYVEYSAIDQALSALAVLNFTVAGVLLLVLTGLGGAGVEVWQRTTKLRRILVTAIVSSSAVAIYDWRWASSYKDGQQDLSAIGKAMCVGFIVAIVLALLTLARPALHLGVRLLAEDTVRAERARLRTAERAKLTRE